MNALSFVPEETVVASKRWVADLAGRDAMEATTSTGVTFLVRFDMTHRYVGFAIADETGFLSVSRDDALAATGLHPDLLDECGEEVERHVKAMACGDEESGVES